MFFRARTPESSCRHTGAPWGRRDIHLPPYWTRAVQAYLPSDDHTAARSLFRQCRLKLALRDWMKSWRFPPHSPRDMTTVTRLEVPEAQAWVGPTTDSSLGVIICESLPPCQLAAIFAFTFTSIQCSSPGKNQPPCTSHPYPSPSQPAKHKEIQTDHSDTYLIVVEIQKNLRLKA